jgi:hypothetical protein
MKAALNAVIWEIFWKNRVVFPALLALLGAGAVSAWTASQAPAGAAWLAPARTLAIMAFLTSVLVGFAPFTLMESSGGWRMNSMITRWFALPMRTAHMVFLPLLAACGFLCLLVLAWKPVLDRLAPGLDAAYSMAVLVVGQMAVNALAWTVPRKPVQFWSGMAVLFPAILLLALLPQDRPHQDQFRRGLLIPLSYAAVALIAFAWVAAGRNRCGAWPGELPLDGLWRRLRGGSGDSGGSPYHGPLTAMFRIDAWPNLRVLGLSWFAVVLALFICVSLEMRDSRRADLAFSLRLLPLIGMAILPVLGMIWMAVWGVLAAGEPAAMFRSRLTAFRATLPVTCGGLAGQRILMLLLGWGIIWLPLVAVSFFHNEALTGIPSENAEVVQTVLARFMAAGAWVLVGALPLFLWGRFEGLPNFLLVAVCFWGLSRGLVDYLPADATNLNGIQRAVLGGLLGVKFLAAGVALTLGIRRGHFTWRFPVWLVAGWVVVLCVLVVVLPTWKSGGLWASLRLALLLPLARLSWCPLAIAANRHR